MTVRNVRSGVTAEVTLAQQPQQSTEVPARIPAESGSGEFDHCVPLLAEFAAMDESDPRRSRLRNELVRAFLPVVEHIASRYRGRGEPLVDLEQVGAIGLVKALGRFEPDRGSDFLSYAIPTITGEIRRYFRDHAWTLRVPRGVKDMQKPVQQAVAELSERLGRAPRPSEIAAHIEAPLQDVIEVLNAAGAYRAESLDAQVGSSGLALAEVLGDVEGELDAVEHRPALRRALAALPPREREILVLRFFRDMTQTQIAERVGISQMHVSRLLSQTLATLRRQMGD